MDNNWSFVALIPPPPPSPPLIHPINFTALFTFADTVAEMAVDVALSEAGNQTSERWEAAPQINTLQRDAIVCPLKSTQK